MCLTCLSCSLLNAGGMPDKELDNIEHYKGYIERQIAKVDDAMDELLVSVVQNDYDCKKDNLLKDEDLAKYTMLMGMKEAYYDCLFWANMIGQPIPRD